MEKISVIIPVYNTEEKYLRQCMDSLITQDYKNLEIILVDDGSVNSAGEICDQYEKQDDRIRVIHQTNQGISAARNKALEIITGEWVAFVDSDDWLEKDAFSVLMRQVKNKTPDLIVWNMYENYPKTERICSNYKESFYTDTAKVIDQIRLRLLRTISIGAEEKNITTIGYPHCHLYRKEIIETHDVKFDREFAQGEDKLFNYQYSAYIHSMLYLNLPLYHYRQHSMSIGHKFYPEHVDNTTRILKKYYEIEPKIKTDKNYRDTYNIRVSYLAWWMIRKYYLHENSTVKEPVKEFKKLVQSSPYAESIKALDVSEMKCSLTKIRLKLLKRHMYRLLFWDAKIELKLRNRK